MKSKAGWITLAVVACLLLPGCFTRYHVTKPDGTELSIVSNREFPEGILVEYESPQGAKLKVDAGAVKTHESAAATGAIGALTQALIGVLAVPRQPPADD